MGLVRTPCFDNVLWKKYDFQFLFKTIFIFKWETIFDQTIIKIWNLTTSTYTNLARVLLFRPILL